MVKQKYIVAGGIVAVLVLVGGGIGFSLYGQNDKPQELSLLSSEDDVVSNYDTSQASGSQSVPLNQTPSKPSSNSNNLGVSTNTSANRLGQITPSQTGATGQGTNGSASSSNAPSPVDPSTFKEYEKYKDGTSALFGDIQKGDGDELTDGKKAAVFYKGWLTNGTLFDQSRPGSDGKLAPFIFTLGAKQVIAGWEQALVGMKVGGVRLVIVPPSVGYGASAQGSIPPNSVLVFQVQLAAVQ